MSMCMVYEGIAYSDLRNYVLRDQSSIFYEVLNFTDFFLQKVRYWRVFF